MSLLYQKTTSSIKWSALKIIVPKLINPLVTIALARILAPESFGMIATAMIVISFSQMFWEAGLSRALIQTDEPVLRVANVVFWSNLILGILVYAIIFLMSPLLSVYFNSPQIILVIRVLSIQIVIMSFTTVQEALFTRDLDFRPLFLASTASSILSGLVSIILAVYGLNVWALVLGTLLGSLVNLLLLWVRSSWRPTAQVDWPLAPKLFRFGFWIVGLSLMGWFINWFDSLLVGRYLGVADLGIYRTGVTMISMLFSLVVAPISAVLFPSFSRLQNDKIKIAKYFHDVNKIIISLVVPVGVGLFLVSNELVLLLLGEKWTGLGAVIGILALSEGLSNCVVINTIIYQAIGKSDIQPKISIFLLPLFIFTYLIAAPLGMMPLLWSKLGLSLFTTPINMIPVVRVFKISPFYIFQQGKYIFVATVFLTVSVLAFQWACNFYIYPSNPFVILFGSIFVGAASYFGLLWVLDRPFLLNVQSLAKSVL
jgi:O-antigen/teichoic acid export membrane protein